VTKRWLALLLCVGVPVGPSFAQAMFHGDASRSGVYPGAGPKTFGGVKWVFKTGGPVIGSPVVAGGVVYVASYDTQLYALDQDTGQEKWKFKSRLPIASTPAVTEDTVFFVSSAGALAAIDRAAGTPKWVFVAEYEKKFEAKNLHGYPSAAQTMPDAWDLFLSSPAVAGGRVFFGTGDGGVYAVDEKTGDLQWKFATGDVVHSSPAVVDGVVYVGSWDSVLYALDAATGAKKWTFQAGKDPAIHNQEGFQSSPAVVDGTVYVGCRDAHLYALDAATGRRKWDYPTSKSWVIATPAVKDGVVYVGTSDSSRFMAIDARTGRLKWNFNARAYMFSSAAIAGDLAYAGDHNGRLYAVDTKTGTLAWEFVTDAARADPQKILNPDGSLKQEVLFAPFFGDFQDMYLTIYRFASIGAIVSSPAVAGGVVFVGSMDGNVYALK
jgi:outer membrane protein assembly factor BamB